MNYSNLEKVLEKKAYTKEKMANALGLSASSFRRSIKIESMRIDVFEKVCEELKVHPLFFLLPNANIDQLDDFDNKRITDILPTNKSELVKVIAENSKQKDEIIKLHAKIVGLLEKSK